MSTNKKHVLSWIESITSVCDKDNWDSYGGKSISKESVEKAKHFIESVDDFPRPECALLSNGCISIEWTLEEGYVEVQFYRENIVLRIDIDEACLNTGKVLPGVLKQALKFYRKEGID